MSEARQLQRRSGVRGLPNIGHRTVRKMWEVRICTAYTAEGNDFECILTVKMGTRHPESVSLVP